MCMSNFESWISGIFYTGLFWLLSEKIKFSTRIHIVPGHGKFMDIQHITCVKANVILNNPLFNL